MLPVRLDRRSSVRSGHWRGFHHFQHIANEFLHRCRRSRRQGLQFPVQSLGYRCHAANYRQRAPFRKIRFACLIQEVRATVKDESEVKDEIAYLAGLFERR